MAEQEKIKPIRIVISLPAHTAVEITGITQDYRREFVQILRKEILPTLRKLVPVRTGRLRRALYVRQRGTKIIVTFRSFAYYWRWVKGLQAELGEKLGAALEGVGDVVIKDRLQIQRDKQEALREKRELEHRKNQKKAAQELRRGFREGEMAARNVASKFEALARIGDVSQEAIALLVRKAMDKLIANAALKAFAATLSNIAGAILSLIF